MMGFLLRRNHNKGFTLLELVIVVAVIGILVVVAIPFLLRARVNANESAAKSNMKTFSTSMETYRAGQTPPTYPDDMSALTTATPAYLDTTWGAGMIATKSGYVYNYVFVDSARYALFAEPAEANVTGKNSFCVDEAGQLWASETSAGAFTDSPCSAGTGATTVQ